MLREKLMLKQGQESKVVLPRELKPAPANSMTLTGFSPAPIWLRLIHDTASFLRFKVDAIIINYKKKGENSFISDFCINCISKFQLTQIIQWVLGFFMY